MKILTGILSACMALLLATGVFVVFLVGAWLPGTAGPESPPSQLWHLASIAAGLALMTAVMRWQPSAMRASSPAILALAASSLVSVLWVGMSAAGSGPIAAVLPVHAMSQLANLAIVLIIPAAIYPMSGRPAWLANWMPQLLGSAAFVVVLMAFSGLNYPNVLILTLTVLVMTLQSGRYLRVASALFASVLCGMLWQVISHQHALSRVLTAVSSPGRARSLSLPERALAHAGWLGLKPGGSELVSLAPGHAANGFVAATLAAMFGWLALGIVLLLLIVLLIAAFQVSRHARDEYDQLLGVGIVVLVGLQVLVHGAAATGYLAMKSVALPFVSADAGGMVASFVGMGLLMGIARRSRKEGRSVAACPRARIANRPRTACRTRLQQGGTP